MVYNDIYDLLGARMNKTTKIVIICLMLSAIIPMQAFSQYATGDALGVSLGGGTLSGISFTGKSEDFPFIFGAGLGYSGTGLGIGVTADYWTLHNELGRVGLADVYLYLGPGVDVDLLLGSVFALDFGARMPVGVSWMVDSPGWEQWEIFSELVVGLNLIGFWTSEQYTALTILGLPLGHDVPFNVFNTLDLGFNIGFRYWL